MSAPRRPLDDGPLREGFRWRQWFIHNRHECRSDWVVVELDPGRTLEQTMRHFCVEAQRETRGRDRWEFVQRGDGSTVVTLRGWLIRPGLNGWLEKLFGSALTPVRKVETLRRLACVQFEAERQVGGNPQ